MLHLIICPDSGTLLSLIQQGFTEVLLMGPDKPALTGIGELCKDRTVSCSPRSPGPTAEPEGDCCSEGGVKGYRSLRTELAK